MMKITLLVALLVAGCAASDPVKVNLYFEGLCPGCHQFILTQLYPTYQKIGEIMDVGLFAYGNARRTKNPNGSWTFTCQHGPAECTTNMMISCFQGHTNQTKEIMDFVHCVVGSSEPQNAGPTCSSGTSVAWDTINTCMHAWEGEALELAVGQATDALNPPHQFVPWPTLDGSFCNDCISDLLPHVCNAYTGADKPAACGDRCYKD